MYIVIKTIIYRSTKSFPGQNTVNSTVNEPFSLAQLAFIIVKVGVIRGRCVIFRTIEQPLYL